MWNPLQKKAGVHFFFTCALLLLPMPNLSQTTKSILVANRNIGIFAAPRNGLFCQRGKFLMDLKAGSEISEYEEIKSYCGFFFEYDYLRVDFMGSSGKIMTGYIHRTDDDGTDRFHIKKTERE